MLVSLATLFLSSFPLYFMCGHSGCVTNCSLMMIIRVSNYYTVLIFLYSYVHRIGIRSIYENDSKQEKIPLLAGSSKGTSIPLYQELINFFFTYRYSRSYTTPYSTSFSHPIFAIIVALLAVVCFILTIVSFIVPYQLPF